MVIHQRSTMKQKKSPFLSKIFLLGFLVGTIDYMLLSYLVNTINLDFDVVIQVNNSRVLWQTALLFFLFITPVLIGNIYFHLGLVMPSRENCYGYSSISQFTRNVTILFTLIYFLSLQPIDLRNNGFPKQTWIEIIVNIVCFMIFFVILNLGFLIKKQDNRIIAKLDFYKLWLKDIYFSRTPITKIVTIINLALSSLCEDILLRGYFILYLGYHFGNYILFGIVSVIISIIAHLYQGKEYVLSHLIFALMLTLITIETKNLIIVTALHAYTNFFAVLWYWRSTKNRDEEKAHNSLIIPS